MVRAPSSKRTRERLQGSEHVRFANDDGLEPEAAGAKIEKFVRPSFVRSVFVSKYARSCHRACPLEKKARRLHNLRAGALAASRESLIRALGPQGQAQPAPALTICLLCTLCRHHPHKTAGPFSISLPPFTTFTSRATLSFVHHQTGQ